jgi:hypothetical protein
MKNKLLSLALATMVLLSTQVGTATHTYAASTTYTASKVYAVTLDCPYHFTLSIQDNKLVVSGYAPDPIDGASIKVDLIKPVNYTAATIGTDDIATITKNTAINLENLESLSQLHPTVIKTLTHTLNNTGNIAPLITVTEADGTKVLTDDISNLPKLSLAGVADGIYSLRVGYSVDPAYARLYCDDIIIAVKSGKASLQVLPTYTRLTTFAGGGTIYRGYSIK